MSFRHSFSYVAYVGSMIQATVLPIDHLQHYVVVVIGSTGVEFASIGWNVCITPQNHGQLGTPIRYNADVHQPEEVSKCLATLRIFICVWRNMKIQHGIIELMLPIIDRFIWYRECVDYVIHLSCRYVIYIHNIDIFLNYSRVEILERNNMMNILERVLSLNQICYISQC